jgi:thiamine biosynthesis lipoprotein
MTAVYRLGRSVAAVAVCLLMLAGSGCGAGGTPPPPDPRPSEARPAETRFTELRLAETRRLMGVPWTITVYGDEVTGRPAIAAAFAEVARLETILSDYDPTSELSRLSATAPAAEPVAVGDDLWRVLERSAEIRDATGGAFDITVGPLTTLWRRSRRSGRRPPPDKLAAARAAVGPETLVLDPASRTARLVRTGMRLDAGGIGRGDAIDRGMEVLATHGIGAAMIDCSGDVAVSGPPPGTAGWRIAVRPFGTGSPVAPDDQDTLILVHAAVTTSGDAYQFVEIDGDRYGHIVDPRTGLGVRDGPAVTVVAPRATTADALATALCVLPLEEGLAILERFPGCAARFAWGDGRAGQTATGSPGRPRTLLSPSWPVVEP